MLPSANNRLIDDVRRSDSSRETTTSSRANVSESELAGMIRAVHLDGDSSRREPHRAVVHGKDDDESVIDTRIPSDLSAEDFEAQARANSRAASMAVGSRADYRNAINRHQQSQPAALRSAGLPMKPSQPGLATHANLPSRPSQYDPHTAVKLPKKPHHSDLPRSDFTRGSPTVRTFAPSPPVSSSTAWTPQAPSFSRGWQQPRFDPGPLYAELAARDKLKPPVLGGRSKKDQLGSVNDSWGELGEEGPKIYGMFEIERDPPSRSTSPFKEPEEQVRPQGNEVRQAKKEALVRAREGTPYSPGWTDVSAGYDMISGRTASSAYPRPTATPAQSDWRDRNTLPLSQDRYPDSVYASHNARRDITQSTPVQTTPASAASRDVFGPRRRVAGWGDDR